MAIHENKILLTYVPEGLGYNNAKMMYIAGRENAKEGDLGTIVLPVHAKDVSIDPALPDTAVFSYSNTEDDVIRLRVVAAKMTHSYTPSGAITSTCTLTVIVPSVEGNWVTRTLNAKLVLALSTETTPGPAALFNPHGLAEDGDFLYFIDYETKRITVVRKDDLEAAEDNGEVLVTQSLDLSALQSPAVALPPGAKGQAIIAMSGKLIALYIVANDLAEEHSPGRLIRLDINGNGTLDDTPANIAQSLVGKNPQSIIPVTTKVNNMDVAKLLIPAIGGSQNYEGGTNETDSNISVLDALAETWPGADDTAPVLVTSDPLPEQQKKDPPTPPEASAYNILGIGAAMRDGDSLVYILTQVYVDEGRGAYWILYKTTVDALLGLQPVSGEPPTLSQALAQSADFNIIDQGIAVAPEYVPDPTYPNVKVPYAIWFWGIVYEQALRKDDLEDRLYLFLGSPFLITKSEAYSSPTTTQINPYVVISGFGGVNVNSVDVTIETLHQAVRGVSLHRGARATRIALATSNKNK
jgi:hypothetical protein